MTTNKPVLRARLRAAREAFAQSTRAAITPSPAFLDRLGPGITVASYVPVRGETDPSPLAQAAADAGCAIALPHVERRSQPMRFLAWDAGDDLHPGQFGLQQPHHDAPDLAPDIILTPLLGFDRRLNRLGQGAGYYDRAFAAFPDAWRIGVAWSVQELDALPVDAWDIPLHAIATEREWLTL